jgi:lysozyme family protein
MSGAFDKAFAKTIGHEGGYVNHPTDPGGETKYGISRRSYPHENISGMTLDRAKLIYLRDYWQPARCGDLPEAIAMELFDGAVNSGIGQATRWLQRALDVADDGVIGPVTLRAAQNVVNHQAVVARMLGHRLEFMAALSTWPSFGKGWARRVAGNLKGVL